MNALGQRQRSDEWMDAPGVDPEALAKSLRFIRKVNWMLGYTRATLSHMDRFARDWKKGETISILDLATGSADIPIAILKWADARGHDVRIVGVDLHAETVVHAQAASTDARLQIVRGDVLNLPFAPASFDYVITQMFLHHMDDDQVVRILSTMHALARRGILAADLLRSRRALFWISMFTMMSHPMVRHDARVSVRQAFTIPEMRDLASQAGLPDASIIRHFGHRFVLTHEKRPTSLKAFEPNDR